MTSRLSVEQKYFKQQSQKLQEHLTSNTNCDFNFVSEYLDSIESSDSWPCVEDLPSLQWINTSRPLGYRHDLMGKLVLFDFFTYCCINCLHALPVLKQVESSHSVAEGLVVVGVHSAKFTNERETSSIERAAERYCILHPIINDHELTLWDLFGISCWPTFLLVSPTGRLIHVMIGETLISQLPQLTELTLRYYQKRGILRPHELPIFPGIASKDNLLKFPGKLHIHPTSGLVFVSDTSHHRVLVLDPHTYSVVKVLGSGMQGARDGPIGVAEFNSPQGLASNGKVLYVADTENHLVREVDLEEGVVRSICGTGLQGSDREGGRASTDQEISSPWDLVVAGDNSQYLFVAMAGTHQIWVHFLADSPWLKGTSHASGSMLRFAGTGDEANRNNFYPHRACFAQPSGLCVDRTDGVLYVADSESGCVRSVSLKDGGVKGVVGGGLDPLDLFSYGDLDGVGRQAKLQHPMGVAFNPNNNSVYVADTYNHKIKVVDLATKSCTTLAGNGKPGCVDGPMDVAQFYEPSGLALDSAKQTLFIADTNNHLVRMIDLTTGIVRTISIEQHEKPIQDGLLDESIHVKVGHTCTLTAVIRLPNSVRLNPGSVWTLDIPSDCSNSLSASVSKGNITADEVCKFQMVYTHHHTTEYVSALLSLSIQYCEGTSCFMNQKNYLILLQYDQSCTELEQSFDVSVNIP